MQEKIKLQLIKFSSQYWDDMHDDYPKFILDADKDSIVLDGNCSPVMQGIARKITLEDTVKFYKEIYFFLNDNLDTYQEYLILGDMEGFYKDLGNMAKLAFHWFRFINNEELIKQAQEHGIKDVSKIHSSDSKDQQVLF